MKKIHLIINGKLLSSLIFILCIFNSFFSYCQDTIFVDSSQVKWCEFEPAKNKINGGSAKLLPPGPLPPNAELLCGSIKLTFMDVVNATGYGFDDPILGSTRRNCVCTVMNYVQSVINFPSSITPSSPIEILFDNSVNNSSSTLGFASPIFPPAFFTNTPGYYGGYVYDYITTGVNPAPINQEHGMITVNFNKLYSYCSPTIGDCEYDFQSLILHEFTHLLGVGSLITENSGVLESAHAPNVFTEFDNLFLYYEQGGSFLKLADITSYSGNGGINPSLPSNMFAFPLYNKVWLNNDVFSSKTNQPIYSQPNFTSGTTLSHFDEDYYYRTNFSPAFSPNYVMNGTIRTASFKNVYTKEDLRVLDLLGYSINTSVITNFTNTPPNLNGNVILTGVGNFPETSIPAGNSNLLISTTNCNPVTIDVGGNQISNGTTSHTLGFYDVDSDPISVFNGQLFNLRGCGNGGNNNNQLTINPANNIITYTPRPNFVGRAQFAFHLSDGIDRGAYVVITIDVTPDACFNNGVEHVINGNLEEGILTRIVSNPNPTVTSDGMNTEFHYIRNRFADGQQFIGSGWQDQGVRDSYVQCLFGSHLYSFPSPGIFPIPNGNIGNRISHISGIEYTHQRLAPEIQQCNNYILSFDVSFHSILASSSCSLNLSLRNTIGGANLFTFDPALTAITNTGTWQTITIPFSYNNTLPANYMLINPNGAFGLIIDNISIVDAPAVTATISGGGSLCPTGSQPLAVTLTGSAPWDIVYNDGTNNITVTGITSSPYIINAISPGTYTLVSVNGFTCGVSGSAKVHLKGGCGPCGSPLGSTTWNTGYALAPGFYNGGGYITVNDDITLTDVILTMSTGGIISVSSGAKLTLEHCHLYACTDMWLGIIVEPGGELIITDGTLIEDAELAVYIGTPNSSTTLLVDNAIFNRNLDAIFIDTYQSTASATYTNFDIKNTVFTCRTLPFSSTWPTVAALQTLTSANTLAEHYTMGGYATTTLKAPYATDKSSSGITLLSVGDLSGGTFYEIVVDGDNGNETFNLFDNLLYGINADNTNLTCKNNAFQYIIEENTSTDGFAINVTDGGAGYNTNNRLKVIEDGVGGTNYFYDCTIGVKADNYNDITVSYADFRSTQMPVSSTPPEGKIGVNISTPNCSQITIDNNNITNIRNGIKFFADGVSATVGGTFYTNAQSIKDVNITNNTIRANYSGATLTNEYVIVGIVADNLITFTDYMLTFPTSEQIIVNNNQLYDVHSGISMNNWLYYYYNFGSFFYNYGNRAVAKDNYIELRNRTYPSSGMGQAGVYHTGNYSNYIINNNVQGFGTNSSVWAGIYSDNLSPGTDGNTIKVECNLTENIAFGNYFINPHYNISFKKNEMKTNKFGLLLDNAIIGNQGSSTYASDNTWTGSYPSGTFTTFTLNSSDPNNSNLFIQSGAAPYDPTVVGTCYSAPFDPALIYSLGNGLSSSSNASTLSCDALPTGKLAGNDSDYDLFSNNADVNRFEQLVTENGMDYGIFPTEQYINAQHRVYRMLKLLPDLKDSSAILTTFYNGKQNSNIAELATVEHTLALGRLDNAEALLSSISPNNNIETHYKSYYTAYLHFKKRACTATDSLALWQMATGCAARDGDIIHQARSLFNLLYQKDYTIYFDDCSDAVIGAKTNRLTTINTQQNRQEQFAVYPNPSNGEFKLELNDKQLNDKLVEITISSLTGKVLYTKKGFIQENNTTFKVALSNGIYVVNVKTSDCYQYSPQRITIIN